MKTKNTAEYKKKVQAVIDRMAEIETELTDAADRIEKFFTDTHKPMSYEAMTKMIEARKLIGMGDYNLAWEMIRKVADWYSPVDFPLVWFRLARAAKLMAG